MQSAPEAQKPASSVATPNSAKAAASPVEFIEFGLGLEMLLETHPVFADAVKAAITPLDGEFLFELPSSDRPDGKGRVAAVRLAYAGSKDKRLAFAVLGDDGMETAIHAPDAQPAHLRSFAQSFVDVLSKIAAH
jgi:hypothetical protein